MAKEDDFTFKSCISMILVLIIFVVGLFFINKIIMGCQCGVAKIFYSVPPYISTYDSDDEMFYHRRHCPYITEDNIGEEYDTRDEVEADGYKPCPHCLD